MLFLFPLPQTNESFVPCNSSKSNRVIADIVGVQKMSRLLSAKKKQMYCKTYFLAIHKFLKH